MEPTVAVGPRGEERLRRGHAWIYRSDVQAVHAAGGAIVRVTGARGRDLGDALYSDRSEIAVRMLTRGGERADEALLRARLEAAHAYRERLAIDATAYRLVHGEGDLLPSLVVDRYGDVLVVQSLSQGMAALEPRIVAMLQERLQPRGILLRNDTRVRDFEGLPREVTVAAGDVPPSVVVREGAVEYEVDLRTAQKTGLFLDQRENRLAALEYARGRVLDCFSYHGGFALHLASRSDETLALDISENAVAQVRRNADRNGLPQVRAEAANVFDALREFERGGQVFDTIVLDPPAFAKQRRSLARALAGYKEINLRALKLLAPGGTLVTCTCSYHVDEATFGEVVFDAATDARAIVTVADKRMQARDHPVLLGVPETYYLKCFILRKLA